MHPLAIRILAGMITISLSTWALAQTPLGAAFTYQGRLKSGGSPASGSHDLQFTLYAGPAGGTIVSGPICAEGINVVDGLFTVPLDFGAVYDGNERWLEIGVRSDITPGNCGTGIYTTLAPRQLLTVTPYSARTLSAPNGIALNAADGSPTNALAVDNNGNVGVGTITPGAKLDVQGAVKIVDGTHGAAKVLTSDANGLASWQTPAAGSGAIGTAFNSGAGSNPSAGAPGPTVMLAQPLTVSITAGQKIFVTSHKTMGTSFSDNSGLDLWIGYRAAGSGATPTTVGDGMFGNRVSPNSQVPLGMSALITGLPAGNYEVGLVGRCTGFNCNWNLSDFSYTTALIIP